MREFLVQNTIGHDDPRPKSSKFAHHAKDSSYDIFVMERESAQPMNEKMNKKLVDTI